MSEIVTFQGRVFVVDLHDKRRVVFGPDVFDFICLMGDAFGTWSPAVTGLVVDGEELVFETHLGPYRLTGDITDIATVTIAPPSVELAR